MKNKTHITLIYRLISRIMKVKCFTLIRQTVSLIHHEIKTQGFQHGIKHVKQMRLHITRYICGKPLLTNNVYVGLDKTGWPKRLLHLKPLINSLNGLRALMTLLTYSKSLKPSVKERRRMKPDYSTIDNKSSLSKTYTIPRWFIREFVKNHKMSLNEPLYTDRDHYISSKMSPNGVSTMSSIWSWRSLSDDSLESIEFFLGGYWSKFTSWWDYVVDLPEMEGITTDHSGKLAIREDPEGKLRVIAMVDYHSQFVLKRIHEDLFSLLRKLPCDRTFTQDPYHKWEDNREYYYSLDLSNATDRFPIDLQAKLLSEIYNNEDYGIHWKQLLVNRSYIDPEGNPHKYSVGQPMGAYSSWAAFTLTHHLVVAWAAHLSKVTPFTFEQYIILGDDIVIKNQRIAQRYTSIMKKLDVQISEAKTHVSPHTYEFAKRWIKGGIEITGIPLKGILNTLELTSIYNTISTYQSRICAIGSDTVTTICFLLDKITFNFSKRKFYLPRKKIKRILLDLDALMKFNRNSSYDELRCYLAKKLGDTDFIIPPKEIIRNYLRALFAEIASPKVIEYATNVESQITDLNDKLSMYYDIPPNIKSNPLSEGLISTFSKSRDRLAEMDDKDFDLIEQSLIVNHPDTDKLVQLFRNPNNTLENACSLWRKMMKVLKEGIVEQPQYGASLARVHDQVTGDANEPERSKDYVLDYKDPDYWYKAIINDSETYKEYTWSKRLQVAYENTLDSYSDENTSEDDDYSY